MPEYSVKGVELKGITRSDGGVPTVYPLKNGTPGEAAETLASQIGQKYGGSATTFAHEQELSVGQNSCTIRTPGKLTQGFSESAGVVIPRAEVTCRGPDGATHTAKVPAPQ